MHVVMALWEGGGTVPVELGVARRLVAAGHVVTVLGEPSLQDAAGAAGARFRPWDTAPQSVQDALADWECATPLTLFHRLLKRVITGPSALYAADLRAAAVEERFDAAVVDAALMGALAGAESLGIPTAVSLPGPYMRPTPGEPPFGLGLSPGRNAVTRLRDRVVPRLLGRLFDLGLDDLNTTRRDLGLGPLTHVWDQLDRADRVLVFTAEAFDSPVTPRPANVRYVGPVLDDPDWAASGAVQLPPGDEPLVLVSLSTGRTRGAAELLTRILAALDQAPVRAVVTTGPSLGHVPSPRQGIRVVPAAPHSQLLHHAAAVVTHGGHGTVIKALAAGRPVLVLPLGRDQPDNAERVVRHQAGLRLRSRAGAGRIAAAVTELVENTSYAEGAQVLGERIRAETDDRRIVSEIVGMVPGDSTPGSRAVG